MELAIARSVDAENPTVGDLRLSGGTLVWTTDLATEVAQRLTVRFNFFKGEWFLDRRQGTPWYQEVFVKDPDPAVLRAIFSSVILGTAGVATLERLTLGEPDADRELSLSFEARLTDGSRFLSSAFGPFLVRVP